MPASTAACATPTSISASNIAFCNTNNKVKLNHIILHYIIMVFSMSRSLLTPRCYYYYYYYCYHYCSQLSSLVESSSLSVVATW